MRQLTAPRLDKRLSISATHAPLAGRTRNG